MKIETFENIGDTINETKNENTLLNKNENNKNGLLNLLNLENISNFSKTILPLLSNLNSIVNKKKSKSIDNSNIVETHEYKEIDNNENLNKQELPSENSQLNIFNVLNNSQQKNNTFANEQIYAMNKKMDKKAVEDRMERHKRIIENLKKQL